jgi:membrane fusion protein, multidrug efflux system
VEVAKVQLQRLEDDVRAVGTLRSNQGVMMRPEVAGRIQRLGFGDGQRVQRGQLLVQLDDSLQQAQLLQSKAQAGIARTNLQRSRDLAAENFLSQSAVDQAAATLAVAEAQVSLSEAQLARMKIVAPFDAVAGIRLINVGDYVKDGADLINLEDISSMWLDFRLPERVIGRIRPGTTIEAELDAQPGALFKGQVDAIDAQVDANGRAMLVRARVRNPGLQLKSGMFARVRAVMGTRDKALVVPEEALVPQGTKQYIYKIVNGEKGVMARREEITVGLRLPGMVEVTGKIEAGDTIVTAGQSRLGRGAEPVPVKVVDLNRPAGARSADRTASDAAPAKGRAASGALVSEAAASTP